MIEPDIVHYVWMDLRADVERKGRLDVVEGREAVVVGEGQRWTGLKLGGRERWAGDSNGVRGILV